MSETLHNDAAWLLPTHRETLLLKAGILEGDGALEAWLEWKNQPFPDQLNERELRLAPLVFRNLKGAIPDDASLKPFETEALRTWTWNQLIMRTFAEVAELFDANGIDGLFLKGSVLLPVYYRDLSARKTVDVDVLVRADDFEKASALLGETNRESNRDQFSDTHFIHEITFSDHRGPAIDLHCHLLFNNCWEGADEDFWEKAQSVTISGRTVRTLCPTDHLIHVLVHGRVWVNLPALRWFGDAATIIRKNDIDWNRLVSLSADLGISQLVSTALEMLSHTVLVSVPPEIPQRLRASPSVFNERLWLRVLSQERRGHFGRTMIYNWVRFSSGVRGKRPLEKLRLGATFLRSRTKTTKWWLAPAVEARRFFRSVVYKRETHDRRREVLTPRKPAKR